MPGERIVVMGPSGSGKSLIGSLLADRLGLEFVDADDLHPASNRRKMTAGIALTDADRFPWLDIVGETMAARGDGVVVACSALRRAYRDRLRRSAPDAAFVELDADERTLAERMRGRTHFMPPSLLRSQLASLEPLQSDELGLVVSNSAAPGAVVDEIVEGLRAI